MQLPDTWHLYKTSSPGVAELLTWDLFKAFYIGVFWKLAKPSCGDVFWQIKFVLAISAGHIVTIFAKLFWILIYCFREEF